MNKLFVIVLFSVLAGCSSQPEVKREPLAPPLSSEFDLNGHLLKPKLPSSTTAQIPKPILHKPIVLPPNQHLQSHLYSVSALQVPVEKLLFQLAVDAHKQLSLDSRINGSISINAKNLPLEEILEQVAGQVGAVFQIQNNMIIVKLDEPRWQTYRVDYVNMKKTASDSIHLNMSVGSVTGTDSGGSGVQGNQSDVSIESNHDFWGTLEQNLKLLVSNQSSNAGSINEGNTSEEGKASPAATTMGSNSVSGQVFVNKEAGLVTVYANTHLQKQVKSYLDQVFHRANQQVLIEATVVEVELSDRYQAGIDWTALNNSGSSTGSISQNLIGNNLSNNPAFSINLASASGNGFSFDLGLKMLQQFGNTKVLSSPKIMAINNQTAVLKVVDNEVYFTIEAETSTSDTGGQSVTYTSTVHTVPVGFVMGVTPFVSDEDEVSLNIRPTLSRIISYVDDPNPSLAQNNIASRIPVIQEREMSSVLRLRNRQTAIIGGLIQGLHGNNKSGVPFLSSLPWGIGDLFTYRDDKATKSELVIFIRPVVIKNPDVIQGDLKHFKSLMPTRSSLN